MATMVASRFAVLSLDDDDDFPKKNQKRKADAKKNVPLSHKSDPSQKKKVKKQDPGKSNSNPNQKVKNKPSAKGDAGNGPKKKPVPQEQWDQWKKKDSEFVDGNYEQDLHQAILLSKLDYEKNQDYYDKLRKNAEEEKKLAASAAKKVKKSNKSQTMSLEQFNSIYVDGATAHRNGDVEVPPIEGKVKNEEDPEFFERIKDDAQKALTREQSIEQRKAREPFIQEAITRAQFEDTLEKRNKEINSLKEEVVKLKEQLHNVKTRNKKLCNILAQGEMRDKAEVLVQVDRLQRVKDELSSEVSNLHAQLEQERSKVRALTSEPRSKSQLYLKKKSVRFDMTTNVAQT